MLLDSPFTRSAATKPNSFDPATRTVSAVIATANPVERRDAKGPFLEILTPDTLDVAASQGVPTLDSHRTASVKDQVGRVQALAIEAGGVVSAVLGFTAADDAAPIVQRIADGTLTGVSIGYRVSG